MCGSCILLDAFPLDGATFFLLFVKILIFFKKDLGSLLIFVLFLKRKQNGDSIGDH